MALPTEILELIQEGKAYLSDLNEEWKDDLKKGCNDCAPKEYYRLARILDSLEDKTEYDEVAQKLIYEMVGIIGGEVTPVGQMLAYFGSKMDGTVLTYSQIVAQGTPVVITDTQNITFPFSVTGFERWWFAIPSVEGAYDKYEDTVNVLNKGDIGTDQDLIGAPTLVTGTVDLNFYQNVYAVPQPNPLIIKKL